MIRVERGQVPRALEAVRSRRLPCVVAKLRAGARLTRKDLVGYGVAKRALWVAQHYKCVYCERQEELDGAPTEHFRPLLEARRDARTVEVGYWWLAWTWQNLFFACNRCNNGAKKTWFPLDVGSTRLAEGDAPPGRERGLLIDPSEDEPLDHIEFYFNHLGKWAPRGVTPRGRETVARLKLEALVDRYTSWVEDYLSHPVDGLVEAIANDDASSVQRAWTLLQSSRLGPTHPFRALSWSYVGSRLSVSELARFGLALERPATSAPHSEMSVADYACLWTSPDPVRDAVLSLGARATAGAWDHSLTALCRHAPQTLDTIVAMTGRTRRTVAHRVGDLVRRGVLAADGGQPQVYTIAE